MINYGKMLLKQEPFSEIVIGNTAIVRAMVESNVRVVTSYPGSPTPEIAVAIDQIPQEKRPFYFEFSTNEKVATEVAYGASVNGHLSCVFFKSVGLNVAADTFVQLGHMNLTGGMVVVLGDDPGAHSSQNEQDNRHIAKLSYTPVLEPSTPSEIYTYFKMAAKISVEKKMPVILRLTTHTCHQKELVNFSEWKPRAFDKTPSFNRDNGPYVPITKAVYPMKRRAIARAKYVSEVDAIKNLNSLINNGSSKGIITAGTTFLSVMDVLDGVEEKPDILKLSLVYPLQKDIILDFLKNHDEVKILEELDPVVENDVKVLAYENGINCVISGKNDPEDMIGEYTPDKVREILSRDWPDKVQSKKVEKAQIDVPARPPQMCPGCGHRSAFYAIKKALKENDIKVGDIGCHTLGFLPPYNMVELLMSMGASTGIASGLELFNDSRKVVCFLGDSTFFHAGAPGIVNAVFNKHDITLILMENGTTAMTGHQEHPATGHNFDETTQKIPVRQMIEGMGIEKIFEVDAYSQKKLTEAVVEAVKHKGISVVIAKHPCMLKFVRKQKRKGVETRQVTIDQKTCDKIAECIESFACPTFYRNNDGSVTINKDLCIGDGSCIQTCPVSAIKY
ncbi:MAG: thiamine pyrophosphate-dependent enzyme [bacterium]